MRKLLWLGAIGAALCLGCDPRVGQEYRGEPLLSITGSLTIDDEHDWGSLAPVIAFIDPTDDPAQGERTFQLLDVDSRGDFPAEFTVDLMQPPPAAAMHRVQGMPSFAIGFVTARPKDHGPEFTVPPYEIPEFPTNEVSERCDGVACYTERRVCLSAGDCYQEWKTCADASFAMCEITKSFGDPELLATYDAWEKAYEREHEVPEEAYLVLYIANDGPLESTRGYVHDRYGALLRAAFGKGPLTTGYSLTRWHSQMTEEEFTTYQACHMAAENAAAAIVGQHHGETFKTYPDLFIYMLLQMPDKPYEHPYFKEFTHESQSESYERDCQDEMIERLDPNAGPLQLTLNYRHLNI